MIQELLVVALLGTWLAATVIRCFVPRFEPWVMRCDRFRLLPSWKFYPGDIRDIDLECRYQSVNSSMDAWHTVTRSAPRPLLTAVWYPQHAATLTVGGLAEFLVEHGDLLRSGLKGNVENGFPYRGLVHCWKSFAPADAVCGQFRIVEHFRTVEQSDAARDAQVLYVSSLLKVDQDSRDVDDVWAADSVGPVIAAQTSGAQTLGKVA